MYPKSWLRDANPRSEDIFESLFLFFSTFKTFQDSFISYSEWYVYSPECRIESWENLLDNNGDEDGPEDTEWEEIHLRNFKCSIDT